MISLKENKIDGYFQILTIDIQSLQVWWKALLLILSNIFAIPAIIVGIIFGYYLWSASMFIAMIISIGYHLCQTTNFCIFGMVLDDWQKTDHTTAASILALSIFLLYIYRPIKNFHHNKKKYYHLNNNNNYNDDDNPEIIIHNHNCNLETLNKLEYDHILKDEDRIKICFKCRGTNPQLLYDWQSVILLYIYIFFIIVVINAYPLTTQSFVLVIVFGITFALLKILVIEEGNPIYLKNRFHFPSLITGIILIIISLIFYFFDNYYIYWALHSLWHVFSDIGLMFILIGTSKDLIQWFTFLDILKFLWKKTKNYCQIFNCCCKVKKNNNNKHNHHHHHHHNHNHHSSYIINKDISELENDYEEYIS